MTVWDFAWYNSKVDRTQRYTVAVGQRGRLVLPAELRRRLDPQPGDRLVVTIEPDGGFRIVLARD
jgi:AbrB family looped-hinge helix DNA binding protein